jgi:hypothetical protein
MTGESMKHLISISFDFESEHPSSWKKHTAATDFCEETHKGIRVTRSQWLIHTDRDVARIAEDLTKAIVAEAPLLPTVRDENEINGGDHLAVSCADGFISLDPAVRAWVSKRLDHRT